MMATKITAAVVLAFGAVCSCAWGQDGADREIAELAAARHSGKENGWEQLQQALAAVGGARQEAEQHWEAAEGRGDGPSIQASELLSGSLPREGVDAGLMYLERALAARLTR